MILQMLRPDGVGERCKFMPRSAALSVSHVIAEGYVKQGRLIYDIPNTSTTNDLVGLSKNLTSTTMVRPG